MNRWIPALWMHSSVAELQNKIHNHVFQASSHSRQDILKHWNSIKFEMESTIKLMDSIVEQQDKCHITYKSPMEDFTLSQQVLGVNTQKSLLPKR